MSKNNILKCLKYFPYNINTELLSQKQNKLFQPKARPVVGSARVLDPSAWPDFLRCLEGIHDVWREDLDENRNFNGNLGTPRTAAFENDVNTLFFQTPICMRISICVYRARRHL